MTNSRQGEEQRGVVAVVCRRQTLLVIRRSQHVVAPGAYCFPGGAVELGESEQQAVCREFREELGASVRPVRRIWTSVAPWRVRLAWWLAELDDDTRLEPNPLEVEGVHWCTADEMRALPGLLTSNLAFLEAWSQNEFELPL